MRRLLVIIGLFSTLLLTVAPAANATSLDGRSTKINSAPCAGGSNCWWSQPGFSGAGATWNYVSNGCYAFPPGMVIRSYAFYGGQEGYFYQSGNCTGGARAVLHNTESADLGFYASSFLGACVSCKK